MEAIGAGGMIWLTFSLVGLIFGSIGVWVLVRPRRFFEQGIQTEGEVIDIAYYKGSAYPVVAYWANGEWINVKSSFGSSPNFHYRGEKVNVWYMPDRPRRFMIEGDRTTKLLGWIFTGFGILFTGIGLMILLFLGF